MNFILLLTPKTETEESQQAAIWEESGYQYNNKRNWAIRIILGDGLENNRIDYPSLNCGGRLVAQSNTDNMHFRETITYGKKFCIDNGMVVLTYENGQMLFKWSSQDGKIGAKGRLQRVVEISNNQENAKPISVPTPLIKVGDNYVYETINQSNTEPSVTTKKTVISSDDEIVFCS